MNSRYVLAGVLVLAVVVMGSMRLVQFTGSISSVGGSQEISVVIDDGSKPLSYTVALISRETAFDALKRVATVDYKMYSNGILITGINDMKQDTEHYWVFFVNDEMPDVASDFFYPVSGDVIKFRYISSAEAANYFK